MASFSVRPVIPARSLRSTAKVTGSPSNAGEKYRDASFRLHRSLSHSNAVTVTASGHVCQVGTPGTQLPRNLSAKSIRNPAAAPAQTVTADPRHAKCVLRSIERHSNPAASHLSEDV